MHHSMYQTGSLRFKETWGKVDPNNNFKTRTRSNNL